MDYKKKSKQELINIINDQDKVIKKAMDLLNDTFKATKRIVMDEIKMYSYFLNQQKIDNILKIGYWVAGIGLGVIIGVII
jgi:hypothetical protein